MGRVLGGVPGPSGTASDRHLLWRRVDGKWEYTLAAMAREEAGFETMEEYIWQRKNTAAQYIATRSILFLGAGMERTPGERVGIWWWDQADIDLAGATETATAAAADEDKDGME